MLEEDTRRDHVREAEVVATGRHDDEVQVSLHVLDLFVDVLSPVAGARHNLEVVNSAAKSPVENLAVGAIDRNVSTSSHRHWRGRYPVDFLSQYPP